MSGKSVAVSLATILYLATAQAKKTEKPAVDCIEAQMRNFYAGIESAKNLIRVDYTVTAADVRPNFDYLNMNDYDKDGIPDKYDLCPETYGIHRRRGCPEWDLRKIVSFAKERIKMSKSDYETTINVFSKLRFDDNHNLDSLSTQGLDQFITLMKRNRNWNISVSSHFDKAKNDKQNRIASEQRLKAVLEYFRKKGIDDKRVKGYYFGNSRPVIDLPPARFEVELDY